MSNLNPTSHEEFLDKRYPNEEIPVNFSLDNESLNDDTIKKSNNFGGGSMSDKYITKEVFDQFEKRIDDKLDSLPDRMADKIDAKISGLEAKQTKWFVGIAISTAIGGLSLLIGAISLIINIFI